MEVRIASGAAKAQAAGWLAFSGIALACFAAAYLLFDGTVAGQSWSDQAYLGSALQPALAQRAANRALQLITPITVALVCLGLLLVGCLRRMPLVGLVAAFGLGVAVLLAQVLRTVLPHPDLATGYEALMGAKVFQTFPSGHATIAMAATLGALLVASRRWRAPVAVIGTLATTLVAAGTVAAHWHRAGDPLGGIALACAIQGACAWFLVRRYGQPVAVTGSGAGLPLACLGAAVVGVAWYLADVRLARASLLPPGVHAWAFPSAVALIGAIACLAVIAFARLLRATDLGRIPASREPLVRGS